MITKTEKKNFIQELMGGEKETLLSIGYRGSGWEDEKTSGDAWWCWWLHNVNVHNTTESNTKNCYSGKFYGMYILPQLQKLFWVKLVSLCHMSFSKQMSSACLCWESILCFPLEKL